MLLICSIATLLLTWMFGARWLEARSWERRLPAPDPRARPTWQRPRARLARLPGPALLVAVVAAVAMGSASPSLAKGLGLPEVAPTTRVYPGQPGTIGAQARPPVGTVVAEASPRDRSAAPTATHAAGYAARESNAAAQQRFKGGDTTVVLGSSALVLILVIVLIVVLL
jgi:hypothetical protein